MLRNIAFALVVLASAASSSRAQEIVTAQDLINQQIQMYPGNTTIGQPIIEFNFPDLTGKFHSPITYRENVLLLWLIGYNNDTSIAFASDIDSLRNSYRDLPVVMLGLDLWNGTHAELTNFRTMTQVGMPLLLNSLSDEYPLAVDSSSMIVVDTNGIVQGIFGEEDLAGIDRLVGLILNPAPLVEWGPQSVYFGQSVEAGQNRRITLTISNVGTQDLQIAGIDSDRSDISFSRTSLTIAPHGGEEVSILFNPTAEGTLEGTITLTTNDPTRQTVDIPIAQTVITPTPVVTPADPRTDFDGSGLVDFNDFLEFAGAFGTTDQKYDLDADGAVGFTDFLTFAENFGKSTS